MKKLAIIVTAAAVLAGTTAGRAPHPYAGAWVGTWQGGGGGGQVEFTIGDNGALSGQFQEADGKTLTNLSGRVRVDGSFQTQGRQQLQARRTGFQGDLDLLAVNEADGTFTRRLADGSVLKGSLDVVRSAN